MFLSLGRYLCWWTISPWLYHQSSSQCFYHWVDTSAGGLLVPGCIISPVVSVSGLILFIKYVCHWHLQFLNHVIIIKTKVLLPQTYLTLADVGGTVQSFRFLALKDFKLFGFLIFWFWEYLMKVIPEKRRAHYIWYLRFYYYHWVDASTGCIISPVVNVPGLILFIY